MPHAGIGEWQVRYEEEGAGDPVLLLADLGAGLSSWRFQRGPLAGRCRVIALDYPAGPCSTAALADVAAGLLAHLGAGPAHVVGSSMGGAVAQELALRHPGLVRSLALHGTWGRCDRALAAVFDNWKAVARALPADELQRQMWPFVFTVWWYNDRPHEADDLAREAMEAPYDPEAFCGHADACIGHDAQARLGQIAAPTLLTVGDRDVLTPAHHTYAIKDEMPDARVRIWQKMGHAPFREAPDEFNAVTLNWIKEH